MGIKHSTQTSKPEREDVDISRVAWNENHVIDGHVTPDTDNAYDFGSDALKIRDIHIGRSIEWAAIFLRQRTGVTVGSNLVMGYGGSAAMGQNNLWACPFIIPSRANITRVAAYCQTAGTVAARARIGLYDDDGNRYPNDLIVDGGEVDCSAVGLKEATVDEDVDPGVYWIVLNWNEAAIAWYHVQTRSFYLISGGLDNHLGWQVALAYGALPATFPGGAAANRSPVGFYRIASWL